MVADPARVGNKLAAVGNGLAASGRWRHSSWVMASLQDELLYSYFGKTRRFVGRMWPSVPAALDFQASGDLGEKAKS